MKSYSSRDVIKQLKADGWYEVNCEGDHHQFKHPTKKRTCDCRTPRQRHTAENLEKHRKTSRDQIHMIPAPNGGERKMCYEAKSFELSP